MRAYFRPFAKPCTLSYLERTYTIKAPWELYVISWWITYREDAFAALALAGVILMLAFC